MRCDFSVHSLVLSLFGQRQFVEGAEPIMTCGGLQSPGTPIRGCAEIYHYEKAKAGNYRMICAAVVPGTLCTLCETPKVIGDTLSEHNEFPNTCACSTLFIDYV